MDWDTFEEFACAVGMESEERKRKSKFYNSFGLRNCIVSFPVEGNIWGRVIISRGDIKILIW